jgi:predicted pyridoxine 5'-phosphate oxidase superfamily flavin-nucleotide-binding protein
LLVLATSTGERLDCSPQGDAPGFVQLLAERTLRLPDRPGTSRIDGLTNLLVTPKVGSLCLVPGAHETYRVPGSAAISTAPELLQRCAGQGKRPRVVLRVSGEEALPHCPQACVRTKLWDATARPPGAPTHGAVATSRDGKDAADAKAYNAQYAERLQTELD